MSQLTNQKLIVSAVVLICSYFLFTTIKQTTCGNHIDNTFYAASDGYKLSKENIDLAYTINKDHISVEKKGLSQGYKTTISINNIQVNEKEIYTSKSGKAATSGDRLIYKNKQVDITYTNLSKGVRQDFIIHDGPTEKASFTVNLSLETELTPRLIDQYSLGLTNASTQEEIYQYRDLLVYDAAGKYLTCSMELSQDDDGSHQIALHAEGDAITYPVTIDPLITSSSSFEPGTDKSLTGYSVLGEIDLNNDGYCDAVVGSPGYAKSLGAQGDLRFVGKADVFYGNPSGIDISGVPGATLYGDTTVFLTGRRGLHSAFGFGYSLASGGDLNLDGYEDLVIGAPNTSYIDTVGGMQDTMKRVGAVHIYYGSATGISSSNKDIVYGDTPLAQMGYSVASNGDFNGNNRKDLVAGAPKYSDNHVEQGAVYVFSGSPQGVESSPYKIIKGEGEYDQFGYSVETLRDIDGNNMDELLIGAPHHTSGTDTSIGKAYLYKGGSSFGDAASWSQVGPHKNAQFGYALAANGDMDDDGIDDILISANKYNPDNLDPTQAHYGKSEGMGGVFGYAGQAGSFGTSPATTYLNDVGASGFGTAISYAGDVDGDGKEDIVVGAPFYSLDVRNEGATYAYYGKNYATGVDTTYDWFVTGEKLGANLGASLSRFICHGQSGVSAILVGAPQYSDSASVTINSAAYTYEGKNGCGLKQYDQPYIVSFPDTLYQNCLADTNGNYVQFDYPVVLDNCGNAQVEVISGPDSGDFFTVGVNEVTFRITSAELPPVDTSFYIILRDITNPVVTQETNTVIKELGLHVPSGMIEYDAPIFDDNCGEENLTVSLFRGPASGTVVDVGVYTVVYEARDQAGNTSYSSFRVIVKDVDKHGDDCLEKVINSSFEAQHATSTDANVGFNQTLAGLISERNPAFGIDLLLSLMEHALGFSLPHWVKAALGKLGTGVDLAFIDVEFNFSPVLDMHFGIGYEYKADNTEESKLKTDVSYVADICTSKPRDLYYGCGDTISMSNSLEVYGASSSMEITPQGIEHELYGYIGDIDFRWPIGFDVSACIGIPLCIPFAGCHHCLGYHASYSKSTNIFDIDILPGIDTLPILTVCDKSFKPGAGHEDLCDNGLFKNIPFPVSALDPFRYDASKDQFSFDVANAPEFAAILPEISLNFGRLTKEEMSPATVRGTALVVNGIEPDLFKGTLDLFSLVPYLIPPEVKCDLAQNGIHIGSENIFITTPESPENEEEAAECSIGFLKRQAAFFKIDVADINVSLRSSLNAEYSFDPVVTIDDFNFNQPIAWERPAKGTSGYSQIIQDVPMNETFKIVVPDGQNEVMIFDTEFSAVGKFTGDLDVTKDLELAINLFKFNKSILFPGSLGPLIETGVIASLDLGTRNLKNFETDIAINNFRGNVSLLPDTIPPVVACRELDVVMNELGWATITMEEAFVPEDSYDLPIDGPGVVELVDVFPDTIYCRDYPSTTGYLVATDGHCNYDTCEFTINLFDFITPELGCEDITIGIGENGTYQLQPDEVIIGATDNCMTINSTVTPNEFTCTDVNTTTTVTVTIMDIAGNERTCEANVTVVDNLPLMIECPYLPEYPAVRSTTELNCIYVANDTEFVPILDAPDCNTMITYELTGATTGSGVSNVGGVEFNLGETVITYSATDAGNNMTSCSFTLIVEDNIDPKIECLNSVVIGTDNDGVMNYNCSTEYIFDHPEPTDNCSIKAYTATRTNPDGSIVVSDLKERLENFDLVENSTYDLGITTIEYTVIDTMDNEVTCSFTITVIDDEDPKIYCDDVVSSNVFTISSPLIVKPNDVSTVSLTVPHAKDITDVNITSLVGAFEDLGEITATLIGPDGDRVELFSNLCTGTSDVDLELDDDATSPVTSASCGPLGGGMAYQPNESLSIYSNQSSQGSWTLEVKNNGLECGVITSFQLEIIGHVLEQGDNRLQVLADEGTCTFTVKDKTLDPTFEDNCEGAVEAQSTYLAPFAETLEGAEFPLGETAVIWTVEDVAGNTSTCEIIVEVIDNTPPVFLNCPQPDIIKNAETEMCGAFANIPALIAEDECGNVTVTQIDETGLSSGSVFPVGTTVLTYQATDASGNTTTCDVRVIINDTQPGIFACPEDMTVTNDEGLCSGTANGIKHLYIQDNCIDNNTVIYQVEYPSGSGNIVASGVEDASGTSFDVGTSTVTYTNLNQPSLLITEVTQEIEAAEGGMSPSPYAVLTTDDYLELTNFGPADYNIGGLLVERYGAAFRDSIVLPSNTIVPSGETAIIHFGNGTDDLATRFFNIVCALDIDTNEPAAYVISYKGRVLDVVATNGYDPTSNPSSTSVPADQWNGSLNTENKGGLIRKFTYDNNTSSDWSIAENCYPLTIGSLNPDLEAYPSNGHTASLQSNPPLENTCSFDVTVQDDEPAQCMQLSDEAVYTGPAMTSSAGNCNTSIITIPEGGDCILNSVTITLNGSISSAEDITINIISPANDTVTLYDASCSGDATLSLTLDDTGADIICGFNGVSRPDGGMLMDYYTTSLAGDWMLSADVAAGSSATLDLSEWSITVTCMEDFSMEDVSIVNDTMFCHRTFTWTHPYISDNCGGGTIEIAYSSDDPELTLPIGGLVSDNQGKGGYEVTSVFPVGTTTVTYTLTDDSGNVSQCGFDVTVRDRDVPTLIYCPNDIVIDLDPGECGRNVEYAVFAEDNCEVVDIIYTPESGSYFGIGTTPVVVQVIDAAGNITLCEFDVIVNEFIPSNNQLSCTNAVNVSLGTNCDLVLTPGLLLGGGTYGCFDNFCIEVTYMDGTPHDNYFTLVDEGKTFKVTIKDCRTDRGNSCWGTVTIEEKSLPDIQCPKDVTLACNQDAHARGDDGLLLTGEAILLNCEVGSTMIYEDYYTDHGNCSNPRMTITRKWVATDTDGNQATCDQIIEIGPVHLENVKFPADIEFNNAFECEDVVRDPSLTHMDNTGYPTLDGIRVSNIGTLCMVSTNVSDEIFDICPGSYEILRTFKLRNMCLPLSDTNPVQHTQIIKVLDTKKPIVEDCPSDTTVSIAPWGCLASAYLQVPSSIYDICGSSDFQAIIYGGGNIATYGNITDGSLRVLATNLRLGVHTVVYRAEDECGNINRCSFELNVVDESKPIISTIQNVVVSISENGPTKLYPYHVDNGSYDGCGDLHLEIRREVDTCGIVGNTTYNNDGHTYDDADDPDNGAYVKVCCEDITNATMDIDGDGILDTGYVKIWLRGWDDADGDGTYGSAGDNQNEAWTFVKVEDKTTPTITCPDDITILCDADDQDMNITGRAKAYGSCDEVDVTYRDIETDINLCKSGIIVRRWSVTGRPDIYCDQVITKQSMNDSDILVSFADVQDKTIVGCPDSIQIGVPTWTGDPCQLVGYTVSSEVYNIEDGACYIQRNTFKVIDWCKYQPEDPRWVETDDFSDGLAVHVQDIYVQDTTRPEILYCQDRVYPVNSSLDQDEDGVICEGDIVLTNTATDLGSDNCPTGWLKWNVTIDLWADGKDDLTYSSNYNAEHPYYVKPTTSGEEASIVLKDIPGSMSNHKVYWSVTDGCGNADACQQNIMVIDNKPPTPYCVAINTALMGTNGEVTLWASDFDQGSFDNCTGKDELRFTFSDVPPEDDPLYDEELRTSQKTFTCTDAINSPVEVQMYVWDLKGNSDNCTVKVELLDNTGICNNSTIVSGTVTTAQGTVISDATMVMNADIPEYPRKGLTSTDGTYSFDRTPYNTAVAVKGVLDKNFRQGVNTLDIVKIQRHILKLDVLNSPHKLIAADINNDGTLKANDLLQLRKLILGIDKTFKNNTSWRLVSHEEKFDHPTHPWPFLETIHLDIGVEESQANDFVAVKVGDVDNSVDELLDPEWVTSRSVRTSYISYEDKKLSRDEAVYIPIKASQDLPLYGFQFTLNANKAKILGVKKGKLDVTDENFAAIGDGTYTFSYHQSDMADIKTGDILYYLHIKSDQTRDISDLIELNGKLLENEIYLGDNYDVYRLELSSTQAIEEEWNNQLLQNIPNPFITTTRIPFNLGIEQSVTFTIMDITGKVVHTLKVDGKPGYNEVVIDAKSLLTDGVYYYRMETDDYSESKKMILLK